MSREQRSIRSIDCALMHARVEAFILEDLPRPEFARLEAHVQRCEACRMLVAAEHELLSLIPRSLEPSPPPPEVLAGLLERVRSDREGRRRIPWRTGALAAAASVLLTLVVFHPTAATSLAARALQSPDVAIINLFNSLDSPLTARYEYRTETHVRFDRSVGRILYNVSTGDWQLVVHGLPRPPRGGHYVLAGLVDGEIIDLGTIERWEDGVATLHGRSAIDLTQTQRLSLVLDARGTRLRLLEAN